MLVKQLQRALDARAAKGTLRGLTVFPSSSSSSSGLVDFSSNDYLSLSSCPQVRADFARFFEGSSEGKMGSTGSRLLDGNTHEHEALERSLSDHFDSEAALLFNSGYDANVSIFCTLPQPDDVILYDELVHASVHDGIRKARTERRFAFAHNSAPALRSILLRLRDEGALEGRNVFVGVESVYSMDGDVCPLTELVEAVAEFVPEERTCFVVDEAHSTAVYGKRGRGLVHSLGLERRIRIRLMTFGKAMGSSGAVVLCGPVVRHFLINYARPLIFSTSLSHVSLYSIQASLAALADGRAEERAKRMFERVETLVAELRRVIEQKKCGELLALPPYLAKGGQASPIVPLLTTQARPLAAFLRARGLLARPICWPTVPKGEDRVRICVHADNRPSDVSRLIACITDWLSTQTTTSKL